MSDAIPFTDNYRDLSSGDGYQFEFVCDRCGNGYRSPFVTDIKARGKGMLRMAGSMLGGRLRSLSYTAETATRWDRGGSKARDKAFAEAVEHVRPQFEQCRGCGNWVCRAVCWNVDAGRCESCAGLGTDDVSMVTAAGPFDESPLAPSAQAPASEVDPGVGVVQCPECSAVVEGGKFCAECGAKLPGTAYCSTCGAELKAGAKFCAECGTKA